MSRELGAWLRAQREERRWTRAEMARRLIKAAENSGDTTMPEVDHVVHSIYRWERGTVGPSERYRLYYCDAFGISIDRFGVQEGKPGETRLPCRSLRGRCCGSPSPSPSPSGGGVEAQISGPSHIHQWTAISYND